MAVGLNRRIELPEQRVRQRFVIAHAYIAYPGGQKPNTAFWFGDKRS
jgi:hypothetical protein